MAIDYLQCLSEFYPDASAICFGDPTVYENIQTANELALPSKADLDIKIIERAKIDKIKELSSDCQKDIIYGFTSYALGYLGFYDSEIEDQLNLAGSLSRTMPTTEFPDGTTTDFAVKPIVDGVKQPKIYVTHTYAQLRQVVDDGVAFKLELLKKFNSKRDIIYTLTTLEAIENISWD